MDRYKFVRHIGSGGFGTVSLYNSLRGKVCIKQLPVPANPSDRKMIMNEIHIISQVKHPNIIKFIEVFRTESHINLVMEYANYGTLRDFIRRVNGNFQKQEVINSFCDILMGLEYLHIRHVIHRDLKPENVLIGLDGRKKIADFGISSVHTRNPSLHDNAGGTLLYIAPEVFRGAKADFKSDVWSLGCILYELCTKRKAINAKSFNELSAMLHYPKYSAIPCSFKQGDGLTHLCQNMLTFNPNSRVSIPEIITNPTILLPYYDLYFNYT